MDGIKVDGVAEDFYRVLGAPREDFLRNFVEAQMMNPEGGQGSGWFFWNFKTEGGAFAEWDFLRGLRDGWIPKLPAPDVDSSDVYDHPSTSCLERLIVCH